HRPRDERCDAAAPAELLGRGMGRGGPFRYPSGVERPLPPLVRQAERGVRAQGTVMLTDHIEGKWVKCFMEVFGLCAVKPGDVVAVVWERQWQKTNGQLSERALVAGGAKPFHIVLPPPPQVYEVPIRSTGASQAIQGVKQIVGALASCTMVVDCTVEGVLHA